MQRMRYLSQIVDQPVQIQLSSGKVAIVARILIQQCQQNKKLLRKYQCLQGDELAQVERDIFLNYLPLPLLEHRLAVF